MKLGKRLAQLESMVVEEYAHIWDCCCDHGLLGAALLSRNAAAHIHFVDIVPELMHQLENKLQRFFPIDTHRSTTNQSQNSQWHIHCLDAAALPLKENEGKQLIIIAGVGGNLISEFMQKICAHHPEIEIDFLLCAVHHNFTLRQQLIAQQVDLHRELLIEENQRYYEILFVTKNPAGKLPHRPVSPAGNQLWHSDNAHQHSIARQYLQKTIAHYQRMQLQSDAHVEHIIQAYAAITLSNNHET